MWEERGMFSSMNSSRDQNINHIIINHILILGIANTITYLRKHDYH